MLFQVISSLCVQAHFSSIENMKSFSFADIEGYEWSAICCEQFEIDLANLMLELSARISCDSYSNGNIEKSAVVPIRHENELICFTDLGALRTIVAIGTRKKVFELIRT